MNHTFNKGQSLVNRGRVDCRDLEGKFAFWSSKRGPRVCAWQLPAPIPLHDMIVDLCFKQTTTIVRRQSRDCCSLIKYSMLVANPADPLTRIHNNYPDNITAHNRRKAPRAAILTGLTQGVKSSRDESCIACDKSVAPHNEGFGRNQQGSCPY